MRTAIWLVAAIGMGCGSTSELESARMVAEQEAGAGGVLAATGGAPGAAGATDRATGGTTHSAAGAAGAATGGAPTGGTETGGTEVCSDGDTRACVGPGVCAGAQLCRAGRWSDCDCGAATGGSVATGGAAGQAGEAATGGSTGGQPTGGTGGVTGGTGGATGGTGGETGGTGGVVSACPALANWRGSTCNSCSTQPEQDGQMCYTVLDCYVRNGCSPATCGAGVCGVVALTVMPIAWSVASEVYSCICIG